MYYLQSRYYDPAVGRFINSDKYASTGEGILGHNTFVYCNNNPCLYIDPYGHEGIVGLGFQTDISTDHGTYGAEIIIYFDDEIVFNTTGDENKEYAVTLYTYSGISFNALELAIAPQLVEIVSSLDLASLNESTNDEILITLCGMLTNYQISASPFVIYAYDNFTSADSYSGAFDAYSLSFSGMNLFSGGVFHAFSDTCSAVGFKFATSLKPTSCLSPLDVQYTRTFYSKPRLIN